MRSRAEGEDRDAEDDAGPAEVADRSVPAVRAVSSAATMAPAADTADMRP